MGSFESLLGWLIVQLVEVRPNTNDHRHARYALLSTEDERTRQSGCNQGSNVTDSAGRAGLRACLGFPYLAFAKACEVSNLPE